MIKRVMIRLCGYLFGLSVCVLHILLCYLLLGWVTTLVVMGVQLLIAAGFIYIRIPVSYTHLTLPTNSRV